MIATDSKPGTMSFVVLADVPSANAGDVDSAYLALHA